MKPISRAIVLCAVVASHAIVAGSQSEQYTALDGWVQVGDMLFPASDESLSSPAGYHPQPPRLWPGGVIPIAFDPSVPAEARERIAIACRSWSRAANVRCVDRTSEPHYAFVSAAAGCSSSVGYLATAAQPLRLVSCDVDRARHEIGHALGLLHEHQRADRDHYIEVLTANIHPAALSTFAIVPGETYGDYDFQSVMHARPDEFSINPPTLKTIQPREGFESSFRSVGAGEFNHPLEGGCGSGGVLISDLSFGDREQIQALYGPPTEHAGTPRALRTASSSGSSMTLAWDPPLGTAPLTQYQIHTMVWTGGFCNWEVYGNFLTNDPPPRIFVPPGTTTHTRTLPAGLYWVQVIAHGTNGPGFHSRGHYFTMPGGTPSNPEPVGRPVLTGEQTTANPIVLSWAPGPGPAPARYKLTASSLPGAQGSRVDYSMGLARSVTASIPESVSYYVSIQACNFMDNCVRSNEVMVRLGLTTPPGPPTLTATQIVANPVSLNWSAGAGGSPQRYMLHAGTSPGASNLLVADMGHTTSVSGDVPVGMPIFARIVAQNVAGSAVSNEISFTVTAPPPPSPPVLRTPIVNGSTVQLSWTGGTPGATYTLLARSSATGPVLVSAPVGGVTSLTVPGVGSGTYYVTAVATVRGQSSADSNQVIVVVP